MEKENEILDEIGHKDGMTVPEGYFADFAARMANSLETTPFEESASQPNLYKPRTTWQKIRPYVYMAAMFAGVWCMLKMFTLMSGNPNDNLQPSSVLATALQNDAFVYDYVYSDLDEWDVMNQMMNEGFDIDLLDVNMDMNGEEEITVETFEL